MQYQLNCSPSRYKQRDQSSSGRYDDRMPNTGEHEAESESSDRHGQWRQNLTAVVEPVLLRFEKWLETYGEDSYDFQTFYAGRYGGLAKTFYYQSRTFGLIAVAPIVFCEALVPSTRSLFWVRQRFPIADAHYAMAFVRLFRHTRDRRYLKRALHFLEVLRNTACQAKSGLGWGYPFDWVTIDGIIPHKTPLITTLPYVYEAFAAVQESEPHSRWRETMHSIAEHAYRDYPDHDAGSGAATCTYSTLPWDRGRVVNANAYRAFLLTRASYDFDSDQYRRAAEPNLHFVLNAQLPDGSWPYAVDGRRQFVDHYHTCFVLKALVKIEQLTGRRDCRMAIENGLRYYAQHLFDAEGLPRPFAKPPRLIVYRKELYDYAECINLLTLVCGTSPILDARLSAAVTDVTTRWQRADGSFRSRKLLIGWDNVPMHRWAQAQLFRSLTGLLSGSAAQEDSAFRGCGK